MPDFAVVSVQEAQLRTLSGRQRTYLNEYAGYIQQLSHGKAGKLHPKEDEKLTTIRRQIVVTAQTLGITLVIRRSGEDIYFWSEAEAEEQPRPRNGRRRRRQEETTEPDQPQYDQGQTSRRGRSQDKIPAPDPPVDEIGMVEQGMPEEESPEVGQTSV